MFKIVDCQDSDLDLKFDFRPLQPWPQFMPALAVQDQGKWAIVAGFRRSSPHLQILLLDEDPIEVLTRLYPRENLRPIESLRFAKVAGQFSVQSPPQLYLLNLREEFQDFLDQKMVPLKVLRPLENLLEWVGEIERAFLSLKPSSSQIRELLDLLCDLKFLGKSWSECAPLSGETQKWIGALTKIRHPLTCSSDQRSFNMVQKVPWPRGVRARWERHGDRAGIHIETTLTSPRDWSSLKTSLQKIEIEDGLWIP